MKRPGSEERFKHISLSEVSFYHLFQSPLKNRIYMYYIVWYHTTYYIITSNYYIMLIYCSTPVQFSSVTWLCPTLWPHESQHARPPCPLPTPGVYSNSCPSSRWCHPAISSCRPLLLLPTIPPSISVFSNESTLHMRWPKYWSFSFSISPSNGHPGLISFRMDWLDLLAVQGTLIPENN